MVSSGLDSSLMVNVTSTVLLALLLSK